MQHICLSAQAPGLSEYVKYLISAFWCNYLSLSNIFNHMFLFFFFYFNRPVLTVSVFPKLFGIL